MNQEQYELFVGRLEQQAERSPAMYKFKVGGMAALGYGYVALMLLLLLAALAALALMILKGSGGVA
ncbi:MAG TPA: hypothetical protein VHK24_11835 [Steroidobacter sp.]|nr:hypothetical protein [Steroidobacter sp.]